MWKIYGLPHAGFLWLVTQKSVLKRLTPPEFIRRARLVHGDRYDYSKIQHIYSSDKVTIICKTHGEFKQTPHSHLKGKGCSDCSGNKQKTTEDFINYLHF
ncbi:MAG TPA: hypothetical protein VF411_04030 [Bacteroidia bacterium]